MTTKQITATNASEQIKQLYQTAFPEEERIPWDDLLRLIGEMHLDSLAVLPEYRRLGIARKLVMTAKKRADRMHLRLGLLVDKDNPEGEAFYTHVGFQYEGDSQWGGHEMKRFVL